MSGDSSQLLRSLLTSELHSYENGLARLNELTTPALHNALTAEDGDTASKDAAGMSSETITAALPAADWENYQRNPMNRAMDHELPEYLLRSNGPVHTTGCLQVAASNEGGRKYDTGKSPIVQGCIAYFGKALTAVGLVSAYGANKYKVEYSDQNWRKVDNAKGRYADALVRHLTAWTRGENTDAESGCQHIDMVAWNALALSELEKA